jgi:hypothetical protein
MGTRTTTIRTIPIMSVVYAIIKKNNMIILEDLFEAYYDCRKNKRKTINALEFELDYEAKLLKLYDDIISKKYKVGKSIVFIVNKPVKREIFA